jgi:tryptophan-rich sensory protein
MQLQSVKKSRLRDVWVLGAWLLICFAVAAAGGAVTATSVNDWYQTLEKPWFTPPDWVFAPVWTALFALMAVAGWRVWRKSGFGGNLIGAALVEIVVLLGAIVVTTILFAQRDRLAGVLLLPYALWVGYAILLNASIWILN